MHFWIQGHCPIPYTVDNIWANPTERNQGKQICTLFFKLYMLHVSYHSVKCQRCFSLQRTLLTLFFFSFFLFFSDFSLIIFCICTCFFVLIRFLNTPQKIKNRVVYWNKVHYMLSLLLFPFFFSKKGKLRFEVTLFRLRVVTIVTLDNLYCSFQGDHTVLETFW